MYLSRVRVRNFRNLKDLTIDFVEGLNVIVGENNVGKTNLLDAIRAALGPAVLVGEPPRLTPEDLHRATNGQRLGNTINVDLWFAGLSEADQSEMLETLNWEPTDPKKTTASIHFEWNWNDKAQRWSVRRWGGERSNAEEPVPDGVLQAVPVTMLNALRDALVHLAPGRQSRLGALLRGTASEEDKNEIERIIRDANGGLENNNLVTKVETNIRSALAEAAGPQLAQHPIVRASEPSFDRIVTNLRLVLRTSTKDPTNPFVFSELRSNGLGYNNLIYIATVLAELAATKNATLPLLFVEEPEAHLHPQLQVLLSSFLERESVRDETVRPVQKIVTTHSPTIAAHVNPTLVQVMHHGTDGQIRSFPLRDANLTSNEAHKLRRMLDVTRASMLFAQGIILVEGITEALLLPVLARRLEQAVDLEQASIAVVPMSGVDFATFGKLFGSSKLKIPVSIVTDGDPGYIGERGQELPRRDGNNTITLCDRVVKLQEEFGKNETVGIYSSDVTLEYDIAKAGLENALALQRAWHSCYERVGGKPTEQELRSATSDEQRAILLWRALCLHGPAHGKAEAAQALATLLEERDSEKKLVVPRFTVPPYIKSAIEHVVHRNGNATH